MPIRTAAAYIRVSTEDQTEYSPDAQLRELRDYAAAHGLILDDRFIYADEGISGRKAEKRPAFLEMIRTAKLPEHPFDVILVHKFDRFARSREDSVVYKSMLKRCGVEVISIKEPLAEGSYGGVMEAIYESFAEAYSLNLGQEVKKGMTEKARRGEIQTAPPYGYMLAVPVRHSERSEAEPKNPSSPSQPPVRHSERSEAEPKNPSPPSQPPVCHSERSEAEPKNPSSPSQPPVRHSERSEAEPKNPSPLSQAPVAAADLSGHNLRTFVPHPVEAEYVREIFRRFAAGEGLFTIAKWLTASGQRTHRGNPFENRTVEYILRNPVYIGKLRWNPTGRSRRDFTDPNIILSDGHHEPLIDLELWDAVQQRMAEVKARWRWHGRPAGDRHHWLCGIVRCAACGTTLIWSKPHYLKCNNYVRGRCTHTQHIAVELLEQAVLAQLRAHLEDGPPPQIRMLRSDPSETSHLRLLRQQLAAVEKKQTRLLDAFLGGADIPIQKYNEMNALLSKEAEALRAEIDATEANSSPSASELSSLIRASIAQTLATLTNDNATTAQKHAAADALIDTCTFEKSSMLLTITYRITI